MDPAFISRTHLYVRGEVIELPLGFYEAEIPVTEYGGAFLKGARLYDYPGYIPYFWSNTSYCYYNLTNSTFLDFPVLFEYV